MLRRISSLLFIAVLAGVSVAAASPCPTTDVIEDPPTSSGPSIRSTAQQSRGLLQRHAGVRRSHLHDRWRHAHHPGLPPGRRPVHDSRADPDHERRGTSTSCDSRTRFPTKRRTRPQRLQGPEHHQSPHPRAPHLGRVARRRRDALLRGRLRRRLRLRHPGRPHGRHLLVPRPPPRLDLPAGLERRLRPDRRSTTAGRHPANVAAMAERQLLVGLSRPRRRRHGRRHA